MISGSSISNPTVSPIVLWYADICINARLGIVESISTRRIRWVIQLNSPGCIAISGPCCRVFWTLFSSNSVQLCYATCSAPLYAVCTLCFYSRYSSYVLLRVPFVMALLAFVDVIQVFTFCDPFRMLALEKWVFVTQSPSGERFTRIPAVRCGIMSWPCHVCILLTWVC